MPEPGDVPGTGAPYGGQGRPTGGGGRTWPGFATGISPNPGEVARVRRHLEELIRRTRCPVVTDTAVLLTSELVTNAILHGSPPLELRAETGGAGLRVEVLDARRLDTLAVRTAAGDAESGRGLVLVDTLASRWGWDRKGRRKVVWFELDV